MPDHPDAPVRPPPKSGEEHLGQTRREWVVQRVAWVIMVLILAAALAGFFGNGPWSERTLTSDDGSLEVEYQRIVRYQAETRLRLMLRPKEYSAGAVQVVFGGDYFSHFELTSVVPEPFEQRSGAGLLYLEFQPVAGDQPVEVTLRAKVETLGTIPGSITLRNGGIPQRVAIEQFALP